MHLNPHSFLPIACIFPALFCGIFVILQNPKAKLNQLFLMICITFVGWFSYYIPNNFDINNNSLELWYRVSYCFISFVPITSFTFISTYINAPKNNFWWRINFFIGLTFCILSLSSNWILSGINHYPWYSYPKAGILLPLLILHCIYLAYLSIKLMLNELRKPNINIREVIHIRYMIVAILTLSLSILDFTGTYIAYYSIGHLTSTIFLIIVTIAIVKHQLMDIKIVFRKSLAYSILVTLITLIFLTLVLLVEKLSQNFIGYQNLFNSITLSLIIALIFIPLKNKIQYIIDRIFFKGTQFEIAQENDLLRQEIIRTERLKTIAILASGIAHEIKNPLTPIKTFAEQLPKRLDDKEFLLKFSRIITNEVNRIDTLVGELLDFAKPTPPLLKSIGIHQFLDHSADFLNNDFIKHRISLIKDYNLPAGQQLSIDETQFRQVLLNIFLNSIDAMPNGGRLTIKTGFPMTFGNTRHEGIKTFGNDRNCVIIIDDTGKGIASEDLPHIFDPFFSKKDRGTGLGLAITHEIIKNHNGKILVESQLGVGTKFIIELPITHPYETTQSGHGQA